MKQLAIRTIVFPKDLWAGGKNVFGGWIMGQMDSAASISLRSYLTSGALTVSVSHMHFKKPIHSGDIVSVYTEVTKIGNTSITMNIDVEVRSSIDNTEHSVTTAEFVFVAVDQNLNHVSVRDVLHSNIDDKDFLALL
jgi:acyl-CoA thioesterase YciA